MSQFNLSRWVEANIGLVVISWCALFAYALYQFTEITVSLTAVVLGFTLLLWHQRREHLELRSRLAGALVCNRLDEVVTTTATLCTFLRAQRKGLSFPFHEALDAVNQAIEMLPFYSGALHDMTEPQLASVDKLFFNLHRLKDCLDYQKEEKDIDGTSAGELEKYSQAIGEVSDKLRTE